MLLRDRAEGVWAPPRADGAAQLCSLSRLSRLWPPALCGGSSRLRRLSSSPASARRSAIRVALHEHLELFRNDAIGFSGFGGV